MRSQPIGIFDSGIGGLTVLKELVKVLPEEDTIYLGDTARVPYGTKSGSAVQRYSIENAEFLLRFGIKLLVVACNTASAYALKELKTTLDIPVVGVIEPGAKMSVEATRTKKIGVIGTEGTIRSGAYVEAIKKISPGVTVSAKACPLFVPLAEEGWTENEVAGLTAKIYLDGLKKEGVDVLLLGCTHYPLLKKTIQTVMGDCKLIDSGYATALNVKGVLAEEGLLKENNPQAIRRFFVTDSPERFMNIGKRFFNANAIEAKLARVGKNG